MLQVVDPEVSEQSQPNTKSELENDSQDTTSSGDEHNASNYSDISIALIDDDKAVCELMAKLLKGYGFDVECFSSISTYAETEKTKPVDICCGMQIPDHSGEVNRGRNVISDIRGTRSFQRVTSK